MNRRSFFSSILGAAVLPKFAEVVTKLGPVAEKLSMAKRIPPPPFTPESIIRTAVPIQIKWQSGHEFEFTDAEIEADMNAFRERYWKPMADKWDREMAEQIAFVSGNEWT